MKNVMCVVGLASLFVAPWASAASAQQVEVGDLVILHAWSRATPGGAKFGVGYMIIENRGARADRLLGASTPAAGNVEVHEEVMSNDAMTMTRVAGGLVIEPGKTVFLAPGGNHLMFINLKAPLEQGTKLPVTLQFERAGKVGVYLDVQPVGAQGPKRGSRA
jgi:copper(I)-binding protein